MTTSLRKILLLVPFSLASLVSYNQQIVTNSTNDFKDIVFAQVYDELETEIPAVIVAPNLIIVALTKYLNYKIFLNDEERLVDEFDDISGFTEREMMDNISCNFIPESPVDTNILINARYKNYILYTIKIHNDNQKQSFNFSLMNNLGEKESKYKNGVLATEYIKSKSSNKLFKRDVTTDSSITKTWYNSSNKFYTVNEDIYKDNKIVKTIIYKKTKDRKKLKVKRTIFYNYSLDGKLVSKKIVNNKGVITDSIKYTFANEKLIAVIKDGKSGRSALFNKYTDNLTVKKRVETPTRIINIAYTYNSNNLLNSFEVSDNTKPLTQKYFFEYNLDQNLIDIKCFNIVSGHSELMLKSQFLFDYFDNRFLKSMIETNESGKIIKEISYDYEFNKN